MSYVGIDFLLDQTEKHVASGRAVDSSLEDCGFDSHVRVSSKPQLVSRRSPSRMLILLEVSS